MTAQELEYLLELLRGAFVDGVAVRAEADWSERLGEIVESYIHSAGGGIILLGVSGPTYAITGVRDAHQVQANLASLCDQVDAMMRPVIVTHQIGQQSVIVAEIPELTYRVDTESLVTICRHETTVVSRRYPKYPQPLA